MELTAQQVAIVERVVKEWHEAGRAHFQAMYQNLDWDSPSYQHHYHVGGKYIGSLRVASGQTEAGSVDRV